MAKGIDIAIAADTRSAMSAINRGLIDPLEDVGELLETIGDDGKDATDKLERGMKDAQRRTDDAKDEIRDLREELNKAGRAGKKAGDDIDDGFRRAEDGAEEFRDEANSTARESAASFDGSAESIADMFQEVAANAFAGFGPAGAVAGLAAAAGIGLAVAGFEQFNEESEASKERAAEWADSYIVAGGRILSATQEVEKARAIVTDPEQYAQAIENAKNWGVSEGTAILAMTGNTDALSEARSRLADKEAEVSEAVEKAGGDIRGLSYDMRTMREEASTGNATLDLLTGEMQRGAQQADVYSESLRLIAQNTEGATVKVDEFGDSVYTLPDGKEIYIDAETGQATEDTDAIERKIYGIKDKNVNINVTNSGLTAAQNAVNRFISTNDGKSFRLHGRVTVDSGAPFS